MPSTSGGLRAALPQIALVAIASAAVIAWAQAPAGGLYGYDGHFHIKYSEWIRAHGTGRRFPWWQETFLADQFADKDLLFHLLLVPFTFGDLEAGGKAASILLGALLYASIGAALACLRVRAPAAWALALLLSSTTLLYRAGLVRSHVVAIPLAVLGTAAILRGSRGGAALASAAYALAHIAWHLLPGIALLHDAARSVLEKRLRWRMTAASLAGTAAAVLTNPYMPNHLRLWWVQNVEVLSMSWSPGAPDLGLGKEILPGSPAQLLYYNIGPAIFTAAGFLLLAAGAPRLWRARPGMAASPEEAEEPEAPGSAGLVTLGTMTAGFLGLSLLSRRFVEFWAPASVLLAACAVTARRRGRPRAPRAAAALGVVLAAGLGLHNVAQARRIIGEDRGLIYRACGSWIRDHVESGRTVFTTDWDEFPQLFFLAPEQRYLVGLDPTFMFVTSPERWRLWRDLVQGRAADIYGPIRSVFGARHAFADAGHEVFIERADHHPLFRLDVGDPDCSVYTLRDPDDAPGAQEALVRAWTLEGGGTLEAGPLDFIDVERLRGAAAGGGECALLRGRIESREAAAARVAISSDDDVQVRVNGALAYDSKAAPPPTLDEALAQHRAGGRRRLERSFDARLAPGSNDVTVSTCKTGAVWGFHLRLLAGPREP